MSALTSYLSSATTSVLLYVRSGLSAELMDGCIRRLENGVPVELFLHEGHEFEISRNPFLLNRCLQFVKKGGLIYLDKKEEVSRIHFVLDYGRAGSGLSEEEIDLIEDPENQYRIQELIKSFILKRSEAFPYLKDAGDIAISLKSDQQIIRKGEEVEISWSISNAEKVMMKGVGEIALNGSSRISPEHSDVITIGAYNRKQSSYATLYVRVIEDLNFNYDIGFLSPINTEYSSLVSSATYPDVYGVLNGHKLRFSWEVLEADSIQIRPFGRTDKKGVVEFMPESSMDIEVVASSGTQSLTRVIQLRLFPVNIFKEKLLTDPQFIRSFNLDLQPSLEIEWKNKLQKIKQWDDHKQSLFVYNDLVDRMKAVYQKYSGVNIHEVRKSFFGILKRKKQSEPQVVEMLQNLAEVYEQGNSVRNTQ